MTSKQATLTTCVVAGAYLLLYSGYDKATKKYKIVSKLTAILTFKDPKQTLIELNKVLGLTAMSTVTAAALSLMCPVTKSSDFTKSLAAQALELSLVHATFSGIQFSDRFFNAKRPAMMLGSISIFALAGLTRAIGNEIPFYCVARPVIEKLLVGRWSTLTWGAISTIAVSAHVMRMETTVETGKIMMRPFGLLGLYTSCLTAAINVVLAIRK